jgi:hypothetical protein
MCTAYFHVLHMSRSGVQQILRQLPYALRRPALSLDDSWL